MPGLTEGRAVRRGQKRRGDYSNLSKGSDGIKRQTSFKDPKVSADKFSIKDQGTVDYAKVESVANPGAPKPYGAGKSRGGGAALRGTKFEGIF